MEGLSIPPSSILDNPQEIDAELSQQCRERVYSRYKSQSVPLYLYVGAPYPLALSKQSSASLYERYQANSLPLYGMGTALSTCSHRQFQFTPLPCDVFFRVGCDVVRAAFSSAPHELFTGSVDRASLR